MAKATSVRLSEALYIAADKAGSIQKRSISKQIEFWAELGKTVERVIKFEDIYAVTQGLKKVNIEPVLSTPVNPQDVFSSLENSREKGELSGNVTSASIYYEASPGSPGLLDRVDSQVGKRQTGRFLNGEFIPK